MKTKILALVAVVTIALSSMAAAQTVNVGIAAEPYPPFTTLDSSGHWTGWEIDLMDAICKDQKLNCEIKSVSWDGIIPALNSGQIDVIFSSMSITAERAKVIDFSNKYYETPIAVIAPKDASFKATHKGMEGLTIGIQVGSTNTTYAQKFFSKTATLKSYQTQDQADQDLASGRIDATFADQFALESFLETEQGKSCCKMIGMLPYDTETLGTGIGAAFRKGDANLREKFNSGIANVRASGEYDSITKKYFNFNIYGK
ncbi:transporter substrate-binding domain-containing protein [Sinorhizobium meliloti]|uniref:transporter substrate-binding domain-containing protein n=1 Tax=Rhizobium meliloti TaxID=382 RepID=UPI0012954ED2|nr:transporter substrate-binding domain-containing protein [Sinorhizobium meliloti]MQW55488.1 transporter substrate-binding domain-containing protein [Sinorhizobium meliloti]